MNNKLLYFIKMIYLVMLVFIIGAILTLESPRNILAGICSSRILNVVMLVISAVIICMLFALFKFLPQNKCHFSFQKSMQILSVVVYLIQIIVIYNIMFYTAWDCGEIRNISWEYVETGIMDTEYLSRNPNNMFLVFITIGIMKLFHFIGDFDTIHYILLCIFALSVNIATYLIAIVAHKITQNGVIAVISYLTAIIIFTFSPWIAIPYSDTLTAVFPILELYVYINKDGFKHRFFYWFTLTLISVLGAYIKPTCIIVFIAIIMIEFFKKKHDWKYLLTKSMIAVVIAAMIPWGINTYLKDRVGVDEEMAFTWAHFLMMGMNESTWGRWAQEDFSFSVDIPTKSERQIQDLERFKERIMDYGLKGTMEQFRRKTVICYGDGTFGWGDEGKFYFVILDRQSRISSILQKVFYPNIERSRYLYTSCLEHFIWIMVLLFQFGILKAGSDKQKMNYVVMLSLIGIFIFVNLFEARGRYLYNFLPVFVLAGAYGLDYLYKKAKVK